MIIKYLYLQNLKIFYLNLKILGIRLIGMVTILINQIAGHQKLKSK